jgi:hypothetical protein
MKASLFLILAFPQLVFATSKSLNCEKGNIKIEIQQSRMGSLKYKYQDTKRKAFANLERSSYTFGGDSDGDIITLELYPQAPVSYTAVFEDYEELMSSSVGTRGIPLLLMVEDNQGFEQHLHVSCEVVARSTI